MIIFHQEYLKNKNNLFYEIKNIKIENYIKEKSINR